MIYRFSKWRMVSAALLAIFFLVVAGLALFYGRAVADGWIALGFALAAVAVLWLGRRLAEVVILGGGEILQSRPGSKTALAWNSVTSVQLRDGETILLGTDRTRISVAANHPAYPVVTQLALDRLTSAVMQDAGTTFALNPAWAMTFAGTSLVCLGLGIWLTQGLRVWFWPGWAIVLLGAALLATLVSLPTRVVLWPDEIEIGRWWGRQHVKRAEVVEARLVRLPGSGQPVVQILRRSGRQIQLQMMDPGQLRLWLALVAWNRGERAQGASDPVRIAGESRYPES